MNMTKNNRNEHKRISTSLKEEVLNVLPLYASNFVVEAIQSVQMGIQHMLVGAIHTWKNITMYV